MTDHLSSQRCAILSYTFSLTKSFHPNRFVGSSTPTLSCPLSLTHVFTTFIFVLRVLSSPVLPHHHTISPHFPSLSCREMRTRRYHPSRAASFLSHTHIYSYCALVYVLICIIHTHSYPSLYPNTPPQNGQSVLHVLATPLQNLSSSGLGSQT